MFHVAAGVGVPAADVADRGKCTRRVRRIGRAPMQRPWMANQDVTDLQRDDPHANLAGLDRPKRVQP